MNHYIDLNKKYFGVIPEDVYKYVRTDKDIPITYKNDVKEILERNNWEPRELVMEPSILDFPEEEWMEYRIIDQLWAIIIMINY